MAPAKNDIVARPDIQGGHAVIRGTRVPAYVLVRALADGATMADICESYAVNEAAVRAALSYAATVLQEERVVAVHRR